MLVVTIAMVFNELAFDRLPRVDLRLSNNVILFLEWSIYSYPL